MPIPWELDSYKMPNTRKSERCPVFGYPAHLSDCKLPTYSDVIKNFLFIRHELRSNSEAAKEPTVSEIAVILSRKIEAIWAKASLPTVSHQQIVAKIRLHHEKYRNLLKPLKGRKLDNRYASKLSDFAREGNQQLFDVSACKCSDFSSCKCKKEQRVPIAEREFLKDQRGLRVMVIGRIDVGATKKMQSLQKQKKMRMDYAVKLNGSSAVTSERYEHTYEESTEEESDGNPDVLETVQCDDKPTGQEIGKCSSATYNSSQFPNVSLICDRYAVSDRCAASIVTATLQDVGLITPTSTNLVVDKNKVRRQRHKLRKKLQNEAHKKVECLYFDGRKDKTRIQCRKGTKFYTRIVPEEHIALVGEPECQYLGHITPISGEAKHIASGIMSYLNQSRINSNELLAVACDGANVNTGALGGVIRLLEEQLGRPLQWLVCLLHTNELPLRHLLQNLDGVTSGPKAFSGTIGKELPHCEEHPLVKFQPIVCEHFPVVDFIDLSNDQKYLYQMCQAVSNGICAEDLAMRKPGPLVHSRWLTMASRLLRFNVATESPSENLITLVTYVVKVYAPVWFSVKFNSKCSEAPLHVWRLVHFSRYLDTKHKAVIDAVIQRNGYFCHTENMLVAMLTDERKHIRELACRRILAARKAAKSPATIRQFRVPRLNFGAEDYIDLVDWITVEKCDPPMLKNISDSQLQAYVDNSSSLDLPNFPCHTQSVERVIKLVTEASAAVCGQDQRDGFIRARVESRKTHKTFETKSSYPLKKLSRN